MSDWDDDLDIEELRDDAAVYSSVTFNCNWCRGEITYTEKPHLMASRTGCPWCHHPVNIPADRARRIRR